MSMMLLGEAEQLSPEQTRWLLIGLGSAAFVWVFYNLCYYWARFSATSNGRDRESFCLGIFELILWNSNEGVAIQKNRVVDRVHCDGKGGITVLCPLLGESVRTRVPIGNRIREWTGKKLVSKNGVPLSCRASIQWKVGNVPAFCKSMDGPWDCDKWLDHSIEGQLRVLISTHDCAGCHCRQRPDRRMRSDFGCHSTPLTLLNPLFSKPIRSFSLNGGCEFGQRKERDSQSASEKGLTALGATGGRSGPPVSCGHHPTNHTGESKPSPVARSAAALGCGRDRWYAGWQLW